MKTLRDLDAIVAAWLDDGPGSLPGDTRHAIAVGIRTMPQRKRGIGWPFDLWHLPVLKLGQVALGIATLAVIGVIGLGLLRSLPSAVFGPAASTDPRTPFLGDWVSTSDVDGGTKTMTVRSSINDTVDVIVTDTADAACNSIASTLTGSGTVEQAGLVVPESDYRCGDLSEPVQPSGQPLSETLHNLTFSYHADTNELTSSLNELWWRPGAIARTPSPTEPAATLPPTDSPNASLPPPERTPSDEPHAAFLGTWISTSDADGGLQTMNVRNSAGASLEIVVTDTIASVCKGTPSTMTGLGVIQGNALVIPTPDYRCDDGSKARPISGNVPVNELLRNLTYTLNARMDALTVGPNEIWRRPDVASPSPTAVISDTPSPSASR